MLACLIISSRSHWTNWSWIWTCIHVSPTRMPLRAAQSTPNRLTRWPSLPPSVLARLLAGPTQAQPIHFHHRLALNQERRCGGVAGGRVHKTRSSQLLRGGCLLHWRGRGSRSRCSDISASLAANPSMQLARLSQQRF